MRDMPFTECIAERKLVLRRDGYALIHVTLQIGRPISLQEFPEDSVCPFRLMGLENEEHMHAVGVDSAQALQLVFHILPSWLDDKARTYGGVFEALGGRDHGFTAAGTAE
jgi:hypothetical protein